MQRSYNEGNPCVSVSVYLSVCLSVYHIYTVGNFRRVLFLKKPSSLMINSQSLPFYGNRTHDYTTTLYILNNNWTSKYRDLHTQRPSYSVVAPKQSEALPKAKILV